MLFSFILIALRLNLPSCSTQSFSHTHGHTHTWPWWLDYSETDVVRRAELMKKVFYWSVNQYFSPLELYSRGQRKVWADTDGLTVIQQIYQLVKISAPFIKYYKCYIPWYDSHIFLTFMAIQWSWEYGCSSCLKILHLYFFHAFSQMFSWRWNELDGIFPAPVFKRQPPLHLCILAFLHVTWNNGGNKYIVEYLIFFQSLIHNSEAF